jgi:hypothetical protein
MSQTDRQRRLRLLARQLNRRRKQQARQIDILCHDLIGAQRTFIGRLQGISFTAQFYKALLGSIDLNDLLERAGRVLRDELPGAGVSFFLRQSDGCELRAFQVGDDLPGEGPRPEDCLPPDLLDRICKANKLCTLDDLLGMHLGGSLKGLERFAPATLPLSDLGRPLGFLFLYRRAPQVLTAAELQRISFVLCGLSQAIRSLRTPLPAGS